MDPVPKERKIDFNYGYRVLCQSCNFENGLTAQQYFDARLRESATCPKMGICSECREQYAVAPQYVSLRDPEDEVLASTRLEEFYWYHSTSEPNWPLGEFTWPDLGSFAQTMPCDELDNKRRNEEDRALHLGTYEAAVENVLRHMDEKGRRDVQFYLYRVQLQDGVKFSDGPVDQDMVAANITQTEVRRRGKNVQGLMYLNHEESIGSISLAVLPEAICKVQRLAMPPEGLVAELYPGILDEVLRIRQQEQEQLQALPVEKSAIASIMRALGKNVNEEQTGSSATKPAAEVAKIRNAAWTRISELCVDRYLAGVSPILRRKFWRSVRQPEKAGVAVDDRDWLTRAQKLEPFLARHEEVLATMDDQPWLTRRR
jgi:hypothetical protein